MVLLSYKNVYKSAGHMTTDSVTATTMHQLAMTIMMSMLLTASRDFNLAKFYTRKSFRLQTRRPTPILPLSRSNRKRKSTRTPWWCLLTVTLAIAQPRPISH